MDREVRAARLFIALAYGRQGEESPKPGVSVSGTMFWPGGTTSLPARHHKAARLTSTFAGYAPAAGRFQERGVAGADQKVGRGLLPGAGRPREGQ
jgi:hypothetical protein